MRPVAKKQILRLQNLYSARGNKRASASTAKRKKAGLKKDAAHLPHVQFFFAGARVSAAETAVRANLGGIYNE